MSRKKDVPALNALIKDIANRRGLTYIDLFSEFVVPGTQDMNPDYSNDGLISERSLSIPNIVLSRLAASAAAAASVEVSASAVASALAIGAILDAKASGGVRSMACITLTILRFFWPLVFSFYG